MVEAYVLMTVKSGKEREIYDAVKAIDEVIAINELYGEWDIIAKIEIEDIRELDAILTDKIRSIEGVELTSTLVAAR